MASPINLVAAYGTALPDVLNAAADHIDEVGHHKRAYYDRDKGLPPERCPVDLYGALYVAVSGAPAPAKWEWTGRQQELLRAAVDALRAHLATKKVPRPQRAPDGTVLLIRWNDAGDRTAADVIALLRDTAATLTDDGEIVDAELVDDTEAEATS